VFRVFLVDKRYTQCIYGMQMSWGEPHDSSPTHLLSNWDKGMAQVLSTFYAVPASLRCNRWNITLLCILLSGLDSHADSFPRARELSTRDVDTVCGELPAPQHFLTLTKQQTYTEMQALSRTIARAPLCALTIRTLSVRTLSTSPLTTRIF